MFDWLVALLSPYCQLFDEGAIEGEPRMPPAPWPLLAALLLALAALGTTAGEQDEVQAWRWANNRRNAPRKFASRACSGRFGCGAKDLAVVLRTSCETTADMQMIWPGPQCSARTSWPPLPPEPACMRCAALWRPHVAALPWPDPRSSPALHTFVCHVPHCSTTWASARRPPRQRCSSRRAAARRLRPASARRPPRQRCSSRRAAARRWGSLNSNRSACNHRCSHSRRRRRVPARAPGAFAH